MVDALIAFDFENAPWFGKGGALEWQACHFNTTPGKHDAADYFTSPTLLEVDIQSLPPGTLRAW